MQYLLNTSQLTDQSAKVYLEINLRVLLSIMMSATVTARDHHHGHHNGGGLAHPKCHLTIGALETDAK